MRHWFTLATLLLLILPVWGQHPDSVYTKDGVALPRHAARKNIRSVYHNHFYHPDTLPCAAAPVLWVVTPPQFQSALGPWLRWKRLTGFQVEILLVGNAHCDSVRQLLQARYATATPLHRIPDYVLLVGDATLIAPFPGRHRPESEMTSYFTDLYYGEFTGDIYPEAVVGRLPAADESQLVAMLDKILAYEQMTLPSTDHLQRALLVAGKENLAPAPTVTNGQVNYLSQSLKTGYPEMDTVCFRNPASEHQLDSIVRRIRQGMGLICYTAHGTIHGWHYPDFTYSISDTLSDPTAAVYVNNCCYSNNFASDCMGTHLIRKVSGGAVGVIGATNSTLWEEDYLWNVGARQEYTLTPQPNIAHPGALDRYLYRQQLPMKQQAWTLGDLMHAGNYAVSESGSIFENYYWEIYNLLGDPTLMPIIGTPTNLHVNAETPLQRGVSALTLHATPYSYVAVSDSGGLLGCGWSDSAGVVRLHLTHSVVTDTLWLTAQAAGGIPAVVPLATVPAGRPCMAVVDYARCGDSLRVWLTNVSEDTCFGHAVALQQWDDDTLGSRIIGIPPQTVDTLAPQQQCVMMLPLTVAEMGQRPFLLLHLLLGDDEVCYNQTQVVLDAAAVRPRLAAVWPLYNGAESHRIERGRVYTLAVAVDNPTDDTAYCRLVSSTETINPGCRDTLYVDLMVADTASHLALPLSLQCGHWRQDTVCWLTVGGDQEDFSSGDLTTYPWDNSSSLQPWRIDNEIHYSGAFSLRSGPIGHRQTSDLALSLYLPYSDTLTFYRRTSSEQDYDELRFYVDGQLYDGWSGQLGWGRARYILPQGRHRLLWRYRKDQSGSHGDDCVWIDQIRLPLAVWDAPYGFPNAFVGIQSVDLQQATPHLYPNPAHGVVTLTGLSASEGDAILYDMSGRAVATLQEGLNDVSGLSDGVYLLAVRTAQQITLLKLILQ